MNSIHPVHMDEPCSVGQCRNSRKLLSMVVTNSLRDYSLFDGTEAELLFYILSQNTQERKTLSSIQEPEIFRFLLPGSITVKGVEFKYRDKDRNLTYF